MERERGIFSLGGEDDWLADFMKDMLAPFSKSQAFTSIGKKTVESTIENNLRKKIIE